MLYDATCNTVFIAAIEKLLKTCVLSDKVKFLVHSDMSTHINASRSGHVCFQLDSNSHAYSSQAFAGAKHSRNEGSSYVASVCSTTSRFPPSSSDSYHHDDPKNNGTSSKSGCATPDKRRTIPLPTPATPIPSCSGQWARHISAALPQITNDLTFAVIHAGLSDAALDLMLTSGKPATVPAASSMTIEIAGLPYYAPLKVLPSHGRSFVTGKDVVRAVVGSLRIPLLQEEIVAIQGKPRSDHVTKDIRRCALLPNGENTCLKGFTLTDARENRWRVG